jgi:hypothetical protein
MARLADQPIDISDGTHFLVVGQAVNEHGERGRLVESGAESLHEMMDCYEDPDVSGKVSNVA